MSITEPTLYQRLQLTNLATLEEIKSAYRALVIKQHPKRNGDPQQFKLLSETYQILSNSDLRHQYDQTQIIPVITWLDPEQVFNDVFSQWLLKYPLISFVFKEHAQDICYLLDQCAGHPIVQLLLTSLSGRKEVSTEDLLKTTNCCTAEWFRRIYPNQSSVNNPIHLNKKVYITLDDMYAGHRYPHRFLITNEDLQLSNDYQIINPEIIANLTLTYTSVEIVTDLHLINQTHCIGYVQSVNIQLEIITMPHQTLHRIRDYDLLLHVNLTLNEFTNNQILCVPYLNRKVLRFKNPLNLNLLQVYQIKGVGLPDKVNRIRGNLYIMFNLIIHREQTSGLLADVTKEFIYSLTPSDLTQILDVKSQFSIPNVFYDIDGLILTSKTKI